MMKPVKKRKKKIKRMINATPYDLTPVRLAIAQTKSGKSDVKSATLKVKGPFFDLMYHSPVYVPDLVNELDRVNAALNAINEVGDGWNTPDNAHEMRMIARKALGIYTPS